MTRLARLAGMALGMAMMCGSLTAQEAPTGWSPPLPESVPNLREDWRQTITTLSTYAKGRNPKFLILMRGGAELFVQGAREVRWDQVMDPIGQNFDKRLPLGAPVRPFLKVVDGVVFNGLYCGEQAFTLPLDQAVRERLADDAEIARQLALGVERPEPGIETGPYSPDARIEQAKSDQIRHKTDLEDHKRRELRAIGVLQGTYHPILSIEDCATPAQVDAARRSADRDHVVSFAQTGDRKLDQVPVGHPPHENAGPVTGLSQVHAWLPNPNGDGFGSKEEWLAALAATSYDALVIDVSWRGTGFITKTDVARLKFKNLGSPRLVLASMPMGRAFDSRWYWQTGWGAGNPPFLFARDPHELGAFIVDAEDPHWKETLGKTIAGIMDLGFDGVMMDDLDWYLWFEDLMPLDQ